MARYRGPPGPAPRPSLALVNYAVVVRGSDRVPESRQETGPQNSFLATHNRPPGWTPIRESHRLFYLASGLPAQERRALINSTTRERQREARDWAREYPSNHIYLPGEQMRVRMNVWLLMGVMMLLSTGFRTCPPEREWSEENDENDLD